MSAAARAVRYAFDEATKSLWRSRSSSLLSTGTIAVALFVLGGFLVTTSNLQRLGEEWSQAAEMSIYLQDEASAADRAGVEVMLQPGNVVAGYEFVSKDEALVRFKETFADLAPTMGTLESNPLPASYEVRLQSAAGASGAIDELAGKLRASPGVSDVRYDRQWLDRLLSIVAMTRLVGWALGSILVVAASLTVAAVVALTLQSRREELDIMQLVGAPQVYVRGPSVMEGLLQGGIGALISVVGLAVLFFSLRGRYLAPLAEAVNLSSVRFLSPSLCVLLLAGGTGIGFLGGLLASRRA